MPPHVITAEIINRGFHQPYQAINELCVEGKINWCRTLNDMAFTIRK
uniref:LlaJI restriction endonuclease n=1 Tax=Podoviridae sp. ct5cR14 TaxID=2825220 RepID=A0A8S5PQD3_9CAUD|nr:MAG TPA: LlaJI restriction endonuclease [Podoviridae sp. ct5cR14]